jgi:endogenous inhibitor of DNA gyrase (YacG/DUF329 family)
MTTVKCPICLKELEVEEAPEKNIIGCGLCGKRVAALMCLYCFSELNLVESDTSEICEV